MDDKKLIKTLLQKTKLMYSKKKEECSISLGGNRLSSAVDMVVSTGIPALDLICAKAGPRQYGLPFGRQVEIFGYESIGKTTLMLQIAANVQKLGGLVYWIETEGGLDLRYANSLGVNSDRIILSQPDYAELVFEEIKIITDIIKESNNKIPVAIMWDSVAATQTKEELVGDFSDTHIASFARLVSQAERKMNLAMSKNKILFCFTNQPKTKIRMGYGFGSPIMTYGEGTLKYYTSIRMQLIPRGLIKEDGKSIGTKVSIKLAKNKCMGTAYYETEPFDLVKGRGFNYGQGLVAALDYRDKIDHSKKGWLKLGGKNFRESRLVELINENQKFRMKCEKLLFARKKE